MQDVLIVDDNEDYADNLAEVLSGEGHQVIVAGRPSEALVIAQRLAFRAALLDIKMPEMDGFQLLALLQAMRPEARYFMITGFTTDARIRRAPWLGVTEVLFKPVDLDRLIALVGMGRA